MAWQLIFVPLVGGTALVVVLFQSVFVMISPERWFRSKYSLKSGLFTEARIRSKWRRLEMRIVGGLGTFLTVYLAVRILRNLL